MKTTNTTKSTKVDNASSTTIRISRETKEKIENLDFVRKHTFDEILNELVEFYDKSHLSLEKKDSLGRKKLNEDKK
jgi:hypothetical protein